MKSNSINITRDQDSLNKILIETQKTSEYAGLNAKQSLRTRLIAEELIGMLKELSENFEGDFLVEQEGTSFDFITRIYLHESMDMETKQKFIDVSTDKKNASAKGIMGKIRDIVENMLYPENALYASTFVAYQLETAVLMNDCWTLSRYKDAQRDNEEPWDELEKSIIANLADEVTVAVKGNNVEIVITKDFKKENA